MKAKKLIAALLLVSLISVAVTSCISEGPIDIDSIPELNTSSEDSSTAVSEEEESTAPGHTERPNYNQIVNVSANQVVIAGTCEEDAIVTITRGVEPVTVQSVGGYFIAEVTLASSGSNRLEMTAIVDGKEESAVRVFYADYKATVSPRPDGLNVMVGLNSQLFLKKNYSDYNGESLLSTSEIDAFKKMINANYESIQAKGISILVDELSYTVEKPDGMTDLEFRDYLADIAREDYTPIEMIYVIVPNAISVYPELVPEDMRTTTNVTKYEQVVKALKSEDVNAHVIDMKEILMEHKDDGYVLFNRTNSYWSDYAAYFAYKEVLDIIDDQYPLAAARPLSDFKVETKTVLGGDLAGYLYFDRELVKDVTTTLTPSTFSYTFPTGEFYNGEDDITLNLDSTDKYAIQNRRVIKTEKENYPNVVIYRDATVTPIYNMLAEKFSLTAFHTIDYLTPRKVDIALEPTPNYVVVFCSESNLDLLLDSSMN